ncbi:hypothetical protein EW146_g2283 [Bondarzewia mesenterica]|uniref:C2H2-type domain-containing protein n=1 Tax=Bondarzewia mesenterica TaxID=1095465 RepID=A0A4S4M143_9AGAM|nr:hypothetical protein EW146_g2283 [Bondarzewia mesenterica]
MHPNVYYKKSTHILPLSPARLSSLSTVMNHPNDLYRSAYHRTSPQHSTDDARSGQYRDNSDSSINASGVPAPYFHSHAAGYPPVLHSHPFTLNSANPHDGHAPSGQGHSGYPLPQHGYSHPHPHPHSQPHAHAPLPAQHSIQYQGYAAPMYHGHTVAPSHQYSPYPSTQQQFIPTPSQLAGHPSPTSAHVYVPGPPPYGAPAPSPPSASASSSPSSSSSSAFECPYCPGITFTRRHDMQRHVQSLHSDIEIKCPFCGKVYAREDSLKRHLKSCADASRGG